MPSEHDVTRREGPTLVPDPPKEIEAATEAWLATKPVDLDNGALAIGRANVVVALKHIEHERHGIVGVDRASDTAHCVCGARLPL